MKIAHTGASLSHGKCQELSSNHEQRGDRAFPSSAQESSIFTFAIPCPLGSFDDVFALERGMQVQVEGAALHWRCTTYSKCQTFYLILQKLPVLTEIRGGSFLRLQVSMLPLLLQGRAFIALLRGYQFFIAALHCYTDGLKCKLATTAMKRPIGIHAEGNQNFCNTRHCSWCQGWMVLLVWKWEAFAIHLADILHNPSPLLLSQIITWYCQDAIRFSGIH